MPVGDFDCCQACLEWYPCKPHGDNMTVTFREQVYGNAAAPCTCDESWITEPVIYPDHKRGPIMCGGNGVAGDLPVTSESGAAAATGSTSTAATTTGPATITTASTTTASTTADMMTEMMTTDGMEVANMTVEPADTGS